MLRRMASWCLTSGSGSGSERYHDHDTGGSETFHVDTHLLNLCAIISPLLTATTIIFLGGFNIEHHCSVSLYANGGRSNNSTTFYYLPASSFRSWSSLIALLFSYFRRYLDVAGGGLRIYGEHSNKTNVESIAKQRTQHFPTYVNTYSIWREEIQNRNRLLDYLSGGEEGGRRKEESTTSMDDGRWR